MSILELKDENLYDLKQKNILIKNINIKIEDGDFVIIIGTNGSGKSTLFKSIFNFQLDIEKYAELRGGKLLYNDLPNVKDLNTHIIYISQEDFPGKPLTKVRNALLEAIPEQVPNKNEYLNNWLNKYKALTQEDKDGEFDRKTKKNKKPLLDKRIYSLSGGQRKWVSILEGLLSSDIKTYNIAFIDEPINNLDAKHIMQLSDLLLRIKSFNPKFAFIIISHCHAFTKITKALEVNNNNINTINYQTHNCFGSFDDEGFYQKEMNPKNE